MCQEKICMWIIRLLLITTVRSILNIYLVLNVHVVTQLSTLMIILYLSSIATFPLKAKPNFNCYRQQNFCINTNFELNRESTQNHIWRS